MGENTTKNKREMNTFLMGLFFFLTAVVGGAVYVLQNYYFIKPDQEFDMLRTYKPRLAQKAGDLKSYDFSIFKSEKFTSLKEGYWYSFDENNLRVGNKEPFVEK